MNKRTMKTVLSIAGSDCSGGAGIQADLKTMTVHGVYGMSVVTALTAQNTRGVSEIYEVTPEFLKEQLDMVFTDIPPNAVKVGMVSSPGLLEVIAERLTFYQAPRIVIDPVMVATSGTRLLKQEGINTLKTRLLPLAWLVTPNIPEAEILGEIPIKNEKDMEVAAEQIGELYGCAVLLKGGHKTGDASDFLYDKGRKTWLPGRRIHNKNTHGTGCTLSSAIASNLAKGYEMEEAVGRAKEYLSKALEDMLDLGKGNGPMNHGFDVNSIFAK